MSRGGICNQHQSVSYKASCSSPEGRPEGAGGTQYIAATGQTDAVCVLFSYKYTLCFFRTGEPYKNFLMK